MTREFFNTLLVFRVIHTIHPAMKHLAQYRFTGESRQSG